MYSPHWRQCKSSSPTARRWPWQGGVRTTNKVYRRTHKGTFYSCSHPHFQVERWINALASITSFRKNTLWRRCSWHLIIYKGTITCRIICSILPCRKRHYSLFRGIFLSWPLLSLGSLPAPFSLRRHCCGIPISMVHRMVNLCWESYSTGETCLSELRWQGRKDKNKDNVDHKQRHSAARRTFKAKEYQL